MRSPRKPRPADLAVTTNRMLLELLHTIYLRRYAGDAPRRFGAALELMTVSMMVSVSTRDGQPLTASEIASSLLMPRSNVDRHLKTLMARGDVQQISRRYHADLDVLDRYMTSREQTNMAIAAIERCLVELKRLSLKLRKELR